MRTAVYPSSFYAPVRDNVKDLRALATFLDSNFKVLGFRFGWDGLLGLIPGLGDLVTSILAFYIIARAAVLGCPPSVLARMGINVLIDNVFDAIPLLGNIFDFIWKSNNRNLALIDNYLAKPTETVRGSRVTIAVTLTLVGFALFGLLTLSLYLLNLIWNAILH